ncbi:MAG: HEAT repeat domain-containing protein [Phycisphaerales bacterium]|nr:HEAT repeat domain-containing protein [Phycisphaerales bacterium]
MRKLATLDVVRMLVIAAGTAVGVPFATAQDAANAGSAQPADDQSADTRRQELTRSEQLSDFLHFVLIARYDLAQAIGQELIRANIPPTEFADLVEKSKDGVSRFQSTVARAMRVPELEPTAGTLLRMYEQGKLSRARDPQQVAEAIKLLGGTSRRGQDFARQRLMAAGEYAMPQLLPALTDSTNPALQAQVSTLLSDMGRQAIIPLVTALPSLRPEQQERVANTLGQIPYRTSLPFLYDLRDSTSSNAVRSAAERAIANVGGSNGGDTSTADLYVQLAENFYDRKSELTSFPGEDVQLVWSYDPGLGLVMTPILSGVYYDAMAMRMTERALQLRSDNPEAVSLWVAANFSREIRQPRGYENPVYPPTRREAMYYAVAAGPQASQRVLARAIDDRDTQLARRAIAAIERTAGGAGLWSGSDTRRPILEALTYPNRRVQYEAALAVAAAQPSETFAGSDRVVPVLTGAIREATAKIGAVIAPDTETYQRLRRVLEAQGYTVLPMARNLEELAGPVVEAPSVDVLLVASQDVSGMPELVQSVRASAKLSAAPVMVLTSVDGYTELRRRYDRDVTIGVRQSSVTDQMLTTAINELVGASSGGPITPEEATLYSARAVSALRDLAISGNTVLRVSDSAGALVTVLGDEKLAASGSVNRLDVAEVLARVNQERAQSAIMEAALTASGPERVAFLSKVADSAKRYGNLLSELHVNRVVELATSSDRAEATAAAAVLGALNLPNADLAKLILSDGTKSSASR